MTRKGLDKKTSIDLVKLLIFIVVTAMATGVLVVLIGNLTFQASRNYQAVFSDVTGVVKGDDVRIAGVKVGTVSGVKIVDTNKAEVSFDVADDAIVTRSSHALVRYRNLVGQRYISLTQGVGDTSRLPEGGTIPISRTAPALDLTELFNGFKPLFAALTPSDVNKLSYEMIQVFQGEGGNLQGLLQNTASVTNTLANRDQLIGQLIDNLNAVLVTVGSRNHQLNSLITDFDTLLRGLAKDRNALLGPLDTISTLSEQTAQFTQGIRPSLVKDVKNLRHVAANINANRAEVDRAFQVLPIKLDKIGRTAIYGSYFNFYLCTFTGRIVLPGGKALPVSYSPLNEARCNLS